MTADRHRFTITTEAWDTRNRSHSKTHRRWTIHADTADAALDEAVRGALNIIGWNTSISTTIEDVNGTGPPVDCPHADNRRHGGFNVRWDGGQDCHACTTPAVTAEQLIADAHTHSGIVTVRRSRQTGSVVALYRPGSQLDVEEGWLTMCLTHDQFVSHDTRKLATYHLADPAGWCEDCQQVATG